MNDPLQPATDWRPDPARLTRPAYLSLAQAVVEAVDAGILHPGDRLPPHRDMAWRLGLSVQTVGRAYAELIRLDAISGEIGRGSFIKGGRRENFDPPYHQLNGHEPMIDCSLMAPVMMPAHVATFTAVLAEIAGDLPGEAVHSFRPRRMMARTRPQWTGFLAGLGLQVPAERVLLTSGNTAGMAAALATAGEPGDLIASEALGHHTLKALTRHLGMKLAGLAFDDQGMRPEALAALARGTRVAALCLTPNGAGPTAAVMGVERRAALVALCRRHDIAIVENDPTGALCDPALVPLTALAPERGYYLTSLTKVTLPGLRVGALVMPENRIAPAHNRHLVFTWMVPGLMAEIAGRLIASGALARMIADQRRALGMRNALARDRLGGFGMAGTDAGLHVWLPLPPDSDEAALVDRARAQGIAIAAGAAFVLPAQQPPGPGVRICLGRPDDAALDHALTRLAALRAAI